MESCPLILDQSGMHFKCEKQSIESFELSLFCLAHQMDHIRHKRRVSAHRMGDSPSFFYFVIEGTQTSIKRGASPRCDVEAGRLADAFLDHVEAFARFVGLDLAASS